MATATRPETHPDYRKPRITPAQLDLISLASGSHSDRSNGLCAMEAAAWLAGETHSDHPNCVSLVIGAFMRSWNDALRTDADRDRLLKPLLPLILDTKADKAAEERRAFLCIDWVVREFTPSWLELCDRKRYKKHVAALGSLPEVTDWEGLIAATPVLVAAQKEAAAAWDAAWAAARDAARAAAWDAAWAAARDAAKKTLNPVANELQASAAALVRRMCEHKAT